MFKRVLSILMVVCMLQTTMMQGAFGAQLQLARTKTSSDIIVNGKVIKDKEVLNDRVNKENAEQKESNYKAIIKANSKLLQVKVNGNSYSIEEGKTHNTIVTAQYSGGKSLNRTAYSVYFSLNPSVASVSKTGVVTGIKAGEAIIAAYYRGKVNVINVKIMPELKTVELNSYFCKLTEGDTYSIKAIATYSDLSEKDVTRQASYTSDDPKIAAVTSGGRITGVAPGKASITVSYKGMENTVVVTVLDKITVDKTALTSLILKASALAESNYTPKSWAELAEALNSAKGIGSKESAAQTEVDSAAAVLTNAINSLQKVADKKALADKIAQAEAINQSGYTSSSWSVFAAALNTAKGINSNGSATQAEVDSATAALANAINSLQKTANKTDLAAKIAQAEALDKSRYTDNSWSALVSALNAAKGINIKEAATQAEVDSASAALVSAINSLQQIANKTALAAKIAQAEALNQSSYTPGSWAALVTALNAAKAINEKESAVQSEVDSAATALTAAISGLTAAVNNPSPVVNNPVRTGTAADWAMVWDDEFNGTNIDTSKWNFVDSGGGFGNNELEYYTSRTENARIENGKLVIEARKENYNGSAYTSAKLTTEGKGDWTYGKYEIRAKLPQTKGLWPAIWMMPSDYNLYSGWPACGEIDIMEMLGHDPITVYGTIHYGNPHDSNGSPYKLPDSKSFADDFHTFTMEWEPGEIRWYVDGILYHTANEWYSKKDGEPLEYTYPAPFDRNFYLQLNVAVGGNWPGNPDASTILPQKMEVDYVRVYKLKDGLSYRAAGDRPSSTTGSSDPADARKPLADGNYIYNGGFSQDISSVTGGEDSIPNVPNTAYWKFLTAGLSGNDFGGQATAAMDNGMAKIDVTNAGTAVYSTQLIQNHIALVKGQKYRITFKAKASKDRNVEVKLSEGGGGWAEYAKTNIPLTTDLQTKSYDFTMQNNTFSSARLELNMGETTGTIWVDDVRIEKLAPDQNTAHISSGTGGYIYNGTFDEGKGRMESWNFIKDSTAIASYSVGSDIPSREFRAAIAYGGNTPESIQLTQSGIPLTSGRSYQITFDARSSATSTLKVDVASADSSNIYSALGSIALTQQMHTYTLAFTSANTDNNAQIRFNMGRNTGFIYIDNVKLVEYVAPAYEKFEAEGYTASQGVDKSNGTYVTSIDAGDWMEYTINAPKTGEYVVSYRIAAAVNTAKLKLEASGTSRTTDLPNTGGLNVWKTVTERMNLTAGSQTIRISGNDVNLDFIEITPNMISNGAPGSDTTGWELWNLANTSTPDSGAVMTVENGMLKIAITNQGSDFWGTQVSQSGLNLVSGKKYRVSFDAKASVNRKLRFAIDNGTGSSRYVYNDGLDLGQNLKTYSFDFVMSGSNSNARLNFCMGTIGSPVGAHDIYFANLKVAEISQVNDSEYFYTTGSVQTVSADKTALAAKIAEAGVPVQSYYTTGSWSAFSTALTAANNVNSNNGATQAEVDQALASLTTALEGLTSINTNELVSDGTFTNGVGAWTAWWGDQWSGASTGTLTVENNELKTSITSIGNVSYSPQVLREGLAFVNGHQYTVSFDARASVARKVNVNVGRALSSDPWYTAYAPTKTYDLTTTVKHYTYIFTMSQATYDNGKIVFELGNIAGGNASPVDVYIDNVSINDNTPAVIPVNKTALAAKIAEAGALVQANYTANSWSALATALSTANAVNSDAAATQAQVDQALADLTAAITGLVNAAPASNELVTDGTFTSGIGAWSSWWGDQWSGVSTGSADVVNGELVVTVNTIGGASYSPQIFRAGMTFENGSQYTVSFDARASVARKVNVNVGRALDNDPWYTAYALTQTYDLTTDMTHYTYTFTMSQATYNNGKIVFELGNVTDGNASPVVVTIDNVSITKVTP